MWKFPSWCLVLAIPFLAACKKSLPDSTGEASQPVDPKVAEIAKSFEAKPDFTKALSGTSSIILHEGLPNPAWESEELKEELAKKSTVEIRTFAFYKETLQMSAADTKQIKELYAANSNFRPFHGFKKCGGYHPDYLLEFNDGTRGVQIEFCFGCHETKAFANDKTLYCEVTSEAQKEIAKVLKKYRKNRPETSLFNRY